MTSRPVPEPEPESLSGGFGTIYINHNGSELLCSKSWCKVASGSSVGLSWGFESSLEQQLVFAVQHLVFDREIGSRRL